MAIKIKNEDKLFEPIINSCSHVADYNIMRKIKDDSLRMQAFSKFLTTYQSYKKDNYIYCVACDKPCACNHEYLLLQEFLHVREKETLHKELLLKSYELFLIENYDFSDVPTEFIKKGIHMENLKNILFKEGFIFSL